MPPQNELFMYNRFGTDYASARTYPRVYHKWDERLMGFIEKIFGTKNDRVLKEMAPRVLAINALEPKMQSLSDEGLTGRITELKELVQKEVKALEARKKKPVREDYNAILDPHLHEVFAIVREAGKRVLNMRHFDVQLIGGMALNDGKVAEMRTGEGKTLVATLPVVLNALTGKGVHVVTVNDYLASRDAGWMGRLYRFLGLSVGVVIPRVGEAAKKKAYEADITYGQNNEFGFDYLRDNMKFSLDDYVQRGHYFSVVDEVDSILIDEARTPLIISGPSGESTDRYVKVNAIIPKLRQDVDYSIDEKSRSVLLTEKGVSHSEELFQIKNLYDSNNVELLHHLNQALRAHALFKRDVDYVIEGGQVVIVDEHTGRLMHGRRWSDGLHQAVEAKERVKVEQENQTLATITFQNYFRMYSKLSGMTGTADTEAEEFAKIYDLDVVVVPTNKPMVRRDEQDQVYKSEHEKVKAIVDDIESSHKAGQPVLVGTVSVEKSEVLSKGLNRKGIAHNVLNAKKHKDEAYFVAQAGKPGSVTIATNMAGRGTDIILGGNAEFQAKQEVSKAMGHSDEQVAEFGFLNGAPKLERAERLARMDMHRPIFFQKFSSMEKDDAPETIEEAEKIIYEERKAYYEKAITLYLEALKKAEASASSQKEQVLKAGGLRIIGTERHESRRIDNQLRGRAGRQGDPGSSCFYLSLEDDLMRIFGSDRMVGLMDRMGMEEDTPIEHPWVSKSIANAQKRVEGMHFDSRKQLIEYDDVMNQQRKSVYGLRREILEGDELRNLIFDLVEEAIVNWVTEAAPDKLAPSEWKLDAISKHVFDIFGVEVDLTHFSGSREDLMDKLFVSIEKHYAEREKHYGGELLRQLEQFVYLQVIDIRWKEHLSHMDHLREGIHFRGYAQKDPKQEYKKEGFNLFVQMMALIRDETLEKVFHAEITANTKERIEEDFSALRENQKKEAMRLRKMHAFKHGEQMSAAEVRKKMSSRGGRTAPQAGPPGLNRHQRRMMKKKQNHAAR